MLKMHIPKHAVINKMRKDGIDEDRFEEVQLVQNLIIIGVFEVADFTAVQQSAPVAPAPPTMDPIMNQMREDGVDEERFQEVTALQTLNIYK